MTSAVSRHKTLNPVTRPQGWIAVWRALAMVGARNT